MGRGRTTTGMIIASLLYLRKMGAFPISKGMKLRGAWMAWMGWMEYTPLSLPLACC